ncbi:MAG: S24/S26 family peptidase [Kineosporiaceae bacterium]
MSVTLLPAVRRGAAGGRAGRAAGTTMWSLAVAAATAWLSLLGGLLVWSTAPAAIGWQPRLVVSGSMSPGIDPGDVVVTAPRGLPGGPLPGTIVAVQDGDRGASTYLHRVVSREPDGSVVTRGDANPSPDHPAIHPEHVLGEARLVIPMVGRPLLGVVHGDPALPLTVAALTGLAGAVLGWRAGRAT